MSKLARINVLGSSCEGLDGVMAVVDLCVGVHIMCWGVEGSRQTEEVKCLSINFFLLYAPEFTAIKINLCELGLSLQDLVTSACVSI